MATMELDDPSGYGRVIRGADGSVERVVETKAAATRRPRSWPSARSTRRLRVRRRRAARGAGRLRSDNAQGELYLPDVLPLLRAQGKPWPRTRSRDPTATLGVNDRVELAEVPQLAAARINERHMLAGVTIVDPATTYIEADVTSAATR
jgi:bifunctional UDP-N-acetylglucosamine pyrophosphorylase/glucosamine-1-phosphate N-acetyltransferase